MIKNSQAEAATFLEKIEALNADLQVKRDRIDVLEAEKRYAHLKLVTKLPSKSFLNASVKFLTFFIENSKRNICSIATVRMKNYSF